MTCSGIGQVSEWRLVPRTAPQRLHCCGFEGEPQQCSRCGAVRGTNLHSLTCPMPEQVIKPANVLLERLSHGRVTSRRLDMRLKENRGNE